MKPETRKEMYYDAILNGGDTPTPITREEMYLDAIARNSTGGTGGSSADLSNYYTKSQTDQRISSKVAEIVSNAPEDFDTLKELSDWIANHEDSAAAMNSEIAANTAAIDTKADKSTTYTKTEVNAALDGKVDKVTGKGLSTNDFTDAYKTKVDGLSNYDDADVKAEIAELASQAAINKSTLGYQRKNLLMNNCKNTTKNGVTTTVNADGSITLNGTNTTSSTKIFYWNMQTGYTGDMVSGQYTGNKKWLPNGKYILSGAVTGMTFQMVFSTDNVSEDRYKSTGSDGTAEFEVTDADKYVWTRLRIAGGASFDNVTIYPMIRPADITDDTYEPYKPSIEERFAALEEKIVALEGGTS